LSSSGVNPDSTRFRLEIGSTIACISRPVIDP
jgi:hypothetical protein